MNTVNEITIHYKRKSWDQDKITNSQKAYVLARKAYNETRSLLDLKEYFFVLYVNQANDLIGYLKLSDGTINSTTADIRLAFATGLKCLATGMILVHNHPSGELTPSDADKRLTDQFNKAGRFLDICIVDHLIISSRSYFSFADKGLL